MSQISLGKLRENEIQMVFNVKKSLYTIKQGSFFFKWKKFVAMGDLLFI
jgi:hypothetical protein